MPPNSKTQSSQIWNQAGWGLSTSQKHSSTFDQFVGRGATSVTLNLVAYYGSTRLTLELQDFTSRLKVSSQEKIEQRWKIFSEDILRLILDSCSNEITGSQANTNHGTVIGQGGLGSSGP